MNFKENIELANKHRDTYIKTLENAIMQKKLAAAEKRKEFFRDIESNSDMLRAEFEKMIGFPSEIYDENEIPEVTWEFLAEEDGIKISRLTLEILDGVKMFGLLFTHGDGKNMPLVLCQHGGAGTPERCCGLMEDGTYNYNDMGERILKKGVNIFAMQLLLWDKEKFTVEYDRHKIDASLKQVGSSIAAVEIYGLRKAIDYLVSEGIADKNKIGMAGLSYGGFFTLFTTAIEKRIKSCLSSCFFNDRNIYSWIDWTWNKSCEKFLDAEVAMLIYPRKLNIQVGDNDELFDIETAKNEYERLLGMCDKIGTQWLDFEVFEGMHEFSPDDRQIDRFIEQINND